MPNIVGKAPVIIFIGPASCGKSTVLVSLAEYLSRPGGGFTVEPNKGFYPNDRQYEDICDKFSKILKVNVGTRSGDFKKAMPKTNYSILVDVKERGVTKFRMLEAAGEDFFDPDKMDNAGNCPAVASYIDTITQKERVYRYPIYYVMLLDLYTNKRDNVRCLLHNDTLRKEYENRLLWLYNRRRRGDKVILLYNKYDEHDMSQNPDWKEFLMSKYSTVDAGMKKSLLGIISYKGYNALLPYVAGINFHDEIDKEGNQEHVYQVNGTVMKSAKDLWPALTKKYSWL